MIDLSDPRRCAGAYLDSIRADDGASTLIYHREEWLAWMREGEGCGCHYAPISEGLLRSRIWGWLAGCEHIPRGAQEPCPVIPRARMVTEILDALAALAILPDGIEEPCWMPGCVGPDPMDLIPTMSGLIHARTGEIHPHTADLYSRHSVPCGWDPDAEAPRWQRFLDELWPGDGESQECLAEWMGYLLTPDTRQQKILVITGPRRSGKGTIARIITALVGDVHTAAVSLAALGTEFGLQPLVGSRVALVSEARLGYRSDRESVTERLLSISGEDRQQVNRKGRSIISARIRTRFVLLSNRLPDLTDESRALTARMIVLAIRESVLGREDTGLTATLLGELPGILAWAVRGLSRLRERGRFAQPAAGLDELSELEASTSPVSTWIEERYEIAADAVLDWDTVWDDWSAYAAHHGIRIGSRQQLSRSIRALHPVVTTIRTRTPAGRRVRSLSGLRRRLQIA